MQRKSFRLRKAVLYFSFINSGFFALILLGIAGVVIANMDFSAKNKFSNKYNFSMSSNIDVRKSGEASIETTVDDALKAQVADMVTALGGHILKERIDIALGNRVSLFYLVKVPTKNYALLIEKVLGLGRLTWLSIEAQDITNAGLLYQERLDAVKLKMKANDPPDPKIRNALLEEMQNIQRKQKDLREDTTYGFLEIRLTDSSRFVTSFLYGFQYGFEGLHWVIRITIIVFIATLPFSSAFAFVKLYKFYSVRRRQRPHVNAADK